jgi:outer membrane receptor for ferrienterochelin and colicins
MLRKTPLALALGMVWSMTPMSVMAQQNLNDTAIAATPAPAGRDRALPEVVAVGHREAQVERKNSDVQKLIVSEEDVERYGDATVGDVLRRLPGMTFTGPAGVSKDVRMRGLDKGYTQFLINGEPVPGASQERQMQVDRLPADMIERIEIIRNPSAEYDASGIGGTINIVLKNRADDLTRLRAAYGRNGSLDVGDVVAQWSRRVDEDMDVILAISHTVGAEDVVEDKEKYNASGAVTEREHKPKPVKKSETLLTPRLTWRFGPDRLTLDPFVSSGTEDKVETSEIRNGAGALNKTTNKTENKRDLLGRLSARYDGQTDWGHWYGKLGMQQGRTDKDAYNVETNGSLVVNKRTQEVETVDDEQVYAGTGMALPLGAHRLKAGVELRQTDYSKHKSAAEANNATNPLTPKAPGANDIYSIEERRSIAYVQDEWQLSEKHWLIPGIRYEHTARDASDRTGATRSSSNIAPNPSLHYRWAYSKNTNVRASVAQTLKLPKFDAVNPLVTLKSGSLTSPDTGGNAELKPERATGVELGIERFLQGNRGVVGINVYTRDVKDYIQKQTRLESGRWVERPYNVGDARFWGAELDWRIPVLRKGAHELTVFGNHAELRGEVRNMKTGSMDDVKDLPPRVTNLGLDWRHLPTRLLAGLAINHAPGYTSDGANDDGVREVKTRNKATLLDFYVGKVFSAKAELRLIAKNILSIEKAETTYKYNADGSFNAGESKTERSRPTVYVTFESRF